MSQHPWSCDSFVVLPDAAAGGAVIFAKNSDREAGEAQPLRRVPARAPGGQLRLAYTTIPDTGAYAHIGSAPFWCWGYEMGVNEHRVAIGNEAIFTRTWAETKAAEEAGNPTPAGILGMELLRLGLERGHTARAALAVITALLEEHGQWGSAKVGTPHAAGGYDNAFLIADPHEAWVLETFGKHWAARRVTTGVAACSNEITLRTDATETSAGLRELALDRGWWRSSYAELDIAEAFSDPKTPLQVSHIRRRRVQTSLEACQADGGVNLANARAILRDHLEDTFLGGPSFNAALPDFHTVCMHEHPAGFTWGNTAASLIVELHADPGRPVALWWNPGTPCTGAYLPVYLEVELPGGADLPAEPDDFDPRNHTQPQFTDESLWWERQFLLDAAKEPSAHAFTSRAQAIRSRFDDLEARWEAHQPTEIDAQELRAFVHAAAAAAHKATWELAAEFKVAPQGSLDARWYR